MKVFSILIFILTSFSSLLSQTTFIVIDSIDIEGNSRTKDYIILNKIDIETGDTIYFNDLAIRFKDNRNRVLDTRLFVDANFNLKDLNTETGKSILKITVKESLFIYPRIIFDLTDRNFNEWYYNHNADLNRINYGLELEHKNISGNQDALKVKWQSGITHKYELEYTRPFLSTTNRIGLTFNTLYKYSKEIAYNTINNKLVFFKNNKKNLFKQFRISLGFTFRPKIYDTHAITLLYFNNLIDESVLDYNSNYFSNTNNQKYFSITYSYRKDKRKYIMYPKGGYLLVGRVLKSGIGVFDEINLLDISIKLEKHFEINKNFISSFILKGKSRIYGNESNYFNSKAIGYDKDLISGYDLYVIDGKDFAYLKTSQRFKITSGFLDLKRTILIKQFKYIPYEFYLSINFDMAYVNNNVNFVVNSFENRLLFGHGAGLDLLLYNNLFQIHYSFNHIGDSGVFFYLKSTF